MNALLEQMGLAALQYSQGSSKTVLRLSRSLSQALKCRLQATSPKSVSSLWLTISWYSPLVESNQ